MTKKELIDKFRKQQAGIARLSSSIHHEKRRRYVTFSQLQEKIYGFKKGDKVRYRGKERWFRGTFDCYFTSNEAHDPLRKKDQEDVLAYFICDDGQRYNVEPSKLEAETDPEEV